MYLAGAKARAKLKLTLSISPKNPVSTTRVTFKATQTAGFLRAPASFGALATAQEQRAVRLGG